MLEDPQAYGIVSLLTRLPPLVRDPILMDNASQQPMVSQVHGLLVIRKEERSVAMSHS